MRFVPTLSVLALLIASPAAAGNLVGTWEGRFSCKTEDANGKGTLTEANSTLQISQPGGPGTSPIRLEIDGIPYSGSIMPAASSPTTDGVGAFVACGTSDTENTFNFSEIELIRWKVSPASGRGSIKKAGVFVTNGVEIGACRGGWVRTSVVDPGIGACP